MSLQVVIANGRKTRADVLQHLRDHLPDVQIILKGSETENESGPQNRLWHPGDIIDGYIQITGTGELETLKTRVSFEGTIRTWELLKTINSDHGAQTKSQSHKFLHQVHQLQHCTRHFERQQNGKHVVKIPFSFSIPKILLPSDTVSEQFLHLPPSIKAGESTIDRAGHVYMQPLISYNLHASADFYSQVIGPVTIQNTREIRLMPFTHVRPPLAIEDFPGEYSFSETRALTKLPFGGSLGDMSISMKEPAALRFIHGSSGGHTAGYLKLVLRSSSASANITGPRRVMCTIRSGILVKVFSSVTPLSGMPSHSMSEADKRVRLQVSHLSLPTRKIEVCLEQSDNERKDTYNSTWTTSLTLPIACSKTLLPTFCSRLAALCYAFKVHLDIKGVYHLPLSLEVPLQVLYCDGGNSLESSSSSFHQLIDEMGIFGPLEHEASEGRPPDYEYS